MLNHDNFRFLGERKLSLLKATSLTTACLLFIGAISAHAGTVVTQSVVNLAPQSQNNVPVTFGQIFKDGDVPTGATLMGSLGGYDVPLQVNSKATNPDGSMRHAIVTVMVPALLGNQKLPLTLSTVSNANPTSDPITLTQLLATNYDARISLSINGQNYTADARSLLQAANQAQSCAPSGEQCNLWLSGPLSSEWVVNTPLIATSGTSGTHVKVYFSVRAYAGTAPGSVGDVRTDVIVENSDAYAIQEQPQYTATVTSGNASYTTPAITQYGYTRWHKLMWWNNNSPQVYLQQDTSYIQNAKVISNYLALTPDESFLAGRRQFCAPMDHCDQTQSMGNTGAQPAIGPLPRWSAVYVIHPDVRAYHWMLANTDALGSYSSHYRDDATGFPISIQKHPYITALDWGYASQVARNNNATGAAYKRDLLQNCFNNSVIKTCSAGFYGTGNPNVWDNAHQPSGAYLPYMVTGDYYYMSELAFGASYNELITNESYRGLTQGLIDGSHGQVRGKAWVLREMADAAYLLPDNHPLKAEFNADVNNSLADWNAKYTNNPAANALGLMNSGPVYNLNGGVANGMAPWQHNFLTWSAAHASDLGFTGATGFRNWLAKFEIGLMTDWQTSTGGFCWLQASAYNLQVKDNAGNWLPSYSAVYASTFPSLPVYACNSPAMLSALSTVRGQTAYVNEMAGYPTSSTGFPANFQIGIAAAADTGLPQAQAAWSLFDSRSMKPSGDGAYNDYPNFAVIPRSVASVPATPPVPPVTPPPPITPPSPPATPPSNPNGITQTLAPSERVVTVGDTFTIAGTLHYPDGTVKPVTAYRLYGYDPTILNTAHEWTPTFKALKLGTTIIRNDNSGVTGYLSITVVAPATTKPPVAVSPVGQDLVTDKKVIHVGDTFTVTGQLKYSDGSSKPVTTYRLYGYDGKIVSTPKEWTPTFTALSAGNTAIRNDNSGVTGIVNVTVVPAGN